MGRSAEGKPRPVDDRLDELHAELCKVFTNPVRVRILNLLRDDELSVGEIADGLGRSQSSVSKHLSLMRSRGILASRKEGNAVYYRVARRGVLRAFDIMRAVLVDSLQAAGDLARKAEAR
ncbi:MAG TPA: metalloregulator ArsR/SmtB family transcription factor [Thermoplasmata archaeon]|nr:metalloregulator ArsR/SmtB family transcription factor [Thermoplasmata archaeon]